MNDLDFKKWDMKTVTINDFSVELPITDDMWKDFLSKKDNIASGFTRGELSKGMLFNVFLKDYIDKIF